MTRLALIGIIAMCCAFGVTDPHAYPQGGAEAAELLHGLQRRYDSVRTVTADFTQERRSAIGRTATGRGTVRIKRIGRMRWDYLSPDEHTFYVNPSGIYLYVPSEKTVYEGRTPSGSCQTAGLQFLSGTLDLTKNFVAVIGVTTHRGETRLVLTPTTNDTTLRALELDLSAGMLLQGFTVSTDVGDSWNIRFSNVRENLELKDSTFEFVRQPDVEILKFGSECVG